MVEIKHYNATELYTLLGCVIIMNLTIYMKSGNKITADQVINWEVKYNSEQITNILVEQKTKGLGRCKNKVSIATIDLKQIDCIVEH